MACLLLSLALLAPALRAYVPNAQKLPAPLLAGDQNLLFAAERGRLRSSWTTTAAASRAAAGRARACGPPPPRRPTGRRAHEERDVRVALLPVALAAAADSRSRGSNLATRVALDRLRRGLGHEDQELVRRRRDALDRRAQNGSLAPAPRRAPARADAFYLASVVLTGNYHAKMNSDAFLIHPDSGKNLTSPLQVTANRRASGAGATCPWPCRRSRR